MIKPWFRLLSLLLVPGGLAAQTTLATNSGSATLPDAPSALISDSLDGPGNPTPPADPTTPSAQSAATPAQQTPPTPQSPTSDAQSRPQADQQLKQEETQRMLGIVPAFNEVIGGHAAPLTPRQKFSLFFHSSIDPYQFAIAGLDAGIEQAEGTYPEYRGGIGGFSKRYGAAFTDNFDGNFWGNAVLPSLLHQDPRYFRLGHGKVLHRILYAAATTVITKGDNGKWEPNYSNVMGNFIGGAISNAYYPASDRGVALTLERGATVSAEGAIGALAEEFYPDYAAWRQRRHARKVAAAAGLPAAPQP